MDSTKSENILLWTMLIFMSITDCHVGVRITFHWYSLLLVIDSGGYKEVQLIKICLTELVSSLFNKKNTKPACRDTSVF